MIYVNNYGWRFANNLFQIACAAALAKRNNDKFVIPKWKYNQYLKTSLTEQNPPYKISSIFKEGDSFQFRKIPYQSNMAIDGYWQSERYFEDCKDYIRGLFQPNEQVLDYLHDNFSDIINNEKIVSIHVRRGDYLNFPDHHPVVNINYLVKAIKIFDDDHKFICFSDDIDWCKDNIPCENITFIENQTDITDFYLMSLCKNNIIANSSFSWWSAWLNKNPNKKIIAPKKWFGTAYAHWDTSDLYPPEWIQI